MRVCWAMAASQKTWAQPSQPLFDSLPYESVSCFRLGRIIGRLPCTHWTARCLRAAKTCYLAAGTREPSSKPKWRANQMQS